MPGQVLFDVPVPMRDGAKLSTDLWLPDSPDPVPTLLVRTPYGKNLFGAGGGPTLNMFEFLRAGYAIVVQDCRGAFKSEGDFVPHVHEAQDGYDTAEWLIQQDWCNGRLGTFGASYLGFVQWDLAATGHDALKVIAPMVTTADPYRSGWRSPGGALSLGTVSIWATLMSLQGAMRQMPAGEEVGADLAVLGADAADIDAACRRMPLSDRPVLSKYMPWMMDTVVGHPMRDDKWKQISAVERIDAIKTPALHVGGWYDLFIGDTLRMYQALTAERMPAEVRQNQMLVVGPWAHSPIGGQAMYRSRSFGMAGSFDAAKLTDTHLALFDRWLKDRGDALAPYAPVRLFVMGIDQWRDEQAWPLPGTRYVDHHLGGEGPANSVQGAGTLSTAAPAETARDTWLYDPYRPVPSLGGTSMIVAGWDGAEDQASVEQRDDVLCFAGPVLSEPVEVTGPVSATLFVESSAVDTDFMVKLIDLHPDGRAIILCDGMLRMRHRNSLEQQDLMVPGEIYEITIDMIATANVFLPGHRIMVEISSSAFPRYDRNTNTGGVIADESESDMVFAINKLHRGGIYPSRITLPIIERPASDPA